VRPLPLRFAFLLSLLTTACGHGQSADRKPDQPPAQPPATTPEQQSAAKLASGLSEQQSWLDALPSCRADDVASASRAVPERGASTDDQVRVRGRLTTTVTKCTMMACRQCERVTDAARSRLVCGAELECCNQCGWDWAVEPAAATPPRALRLQRPGDGGPFQGAGLDCVLKHLPAPEVVVAGRLAEGDLIVNADLCVVRPTK
jgi:hypothetical protein